MTPDELRQLDAEVAEKVMNLPEVEFVGERLQYHDLERDAKYGGRWSTIVPGYAGEITHSMKVVAQMRSLGWSFACTLYAGELPYASFCKKTAASSRNAEAETLEIAICKAALAAIESSATISTKEKSPL